MPVPVAGDRHRVDGVDLAASGAQARDQQPAGCLDRYRDGLSGAVAVLGEQVEQGGQAGRVVADPAAGQQLAVPVHQGDVVVILGPVDAAEHLCAHCVLLDMSSVRAGLSHAGHARSLMEGLKGTAIRSAVRDPSCPQAPVFGGARRGSGRGEGLLLAGGSGHDQLYPGTDSDVRRYLVRLARRRPAPAMTRRWRLRRRSPHGGLPRSGRGTRRARVRDRPLQPKRGCHRRTTSTGEKCLADVHAKPRLAWSLCRPRGQEARARPGPAFPGARRAR